ncbi:MAG: GtrA family protein, partial [Clostridia bacterium]|nr:GtrA family protein [Clostridia bacterium]
MKRLWKTIKNLFLKKDFILFVAIGGVNTLTSIVVSYLLSDWFNPNLSYVIGYVVGFLVSYLLNSFFTFHESLSFGKLAK